jgi:hypothetical protein
MTTSDEGVCYGKRQRYHPAHSLSGELNYHCEGIS